MSKKSRKPRTYRPEEIREIREGVYKILHSVGFKCNRMLENYECIFLHEFGKRIAPHMRMNLTVEKKTND